MKEKLKSLNFSLILFLAFMVKMIVVSPTVADSLIVFCLGAVYSYSQYLKRFQPYKLEEAVMRDLNEVRVALSKMNVIRAAEKMSEKKYF